MGSILWKIDSGRDLLRHLVEEAEATERRANLQLTQRAAAQMKALAAGIRESAVIVDAYVRQTPDEPLGVPTRSYTDVRADILGRTLAEWRRKIEAEMTLLGGWWHPSPPSSQADFDYRWQVAEDCIIVQYYDDATREWVTVNDVFGTMSSAIKFVAEKYVKRKAV